MEEKAAINNYLRLMGVNDNVINYININYIPITPYFEELLGKDFYRWKGETYQQNYIEILKQGSDNFKILDNGSIWFSNISTPKIDNRAKFVKGFLSDNDNLKFDEIKTSTYISFENNQIINRRLEIKKYTEEEKQKNSMMKDKEDYFKGTIKEEVYESDLKGKISKQATFYSTSENIPDKEIETMVQKIDKDGHVLKTNHENASYNNSIWNLVLNGKTKAQSLIENINEKRLSRSEKLKLVQKSIFSRIAKSQSKQYEQLRAESLEQMKNESLDEIIHSDFSMKGNNGEVCTYTLEKITEKSREVISQIDFKNTEQFREQFLHPLIVDYAQSNFIIKGSVEPIIGKSSQYKAFSATNNLLTVKNISKEYADYIATEVKKVDPIIYQKKMEQNEIQRENQSEYGYQKINTKSSGFLDVMLLASIVGFVAGLLLFVMCLILKYNVMN